MLWGQWCREKVSGLGKAASVSSGQCHMPVPPRRSSWTSTFCLDFQNCMSKPLFFYYFHIELEALLHKYNFLQHRLIFLDHEI